MGSDNPISRPTPRDSLPPERLHFLRGPPFSKLTDYQAAIFHIQIAAETTGVLSSLSKDSTRQMLGAVFCSESLSRYPENFDTLRPAWVTSEGTWTSSWWPKQEEGSFLPFQAGSLCFFVHHFTSSPSQRILGGWAQLPPHSCNRELRSVFSGILYCLGLTWLGWQGMNRPTDTHTEKLG